MNTVERDFAILALLIVASLVFNVYRALTGGRRKRGLRESADRATAERRSTEAAPISGLPEYAAAQGWRELGDPGFDTGGAQYMRTMLRNLASGPEGATEGGVEAPRYTNLYGGQLDGMAFVVGNAWLTRDAADLPGSVCAMQVGAALPPLFVNLRAHAPFVRAFLKEMPLESEEFNRRFQVLALDREYAMDVLSPRVMELLLARDDWVFFLEMSRLICVCATPLVSLADYQARVEAVGEFVSLIPAFVRQDRAMALPTFPDGTTFDPQDPASLARAKTTLEAMSPDERRAFMLKLEAGGARFVAGMFGKDLPEGVAEEAARSVMDKEEQRHPDRFAGGPEPPPAAG